MKPTADAIVFITGQGEVDGVPYVEYLNLSTNETWRVWGKCNACGACEVGNSNPNLYWTGIPVGEAGACVDVTFGERLDIPVGLGLPEKYPTCTLKSEAI
jgi:hypothetical protein